MCQRRPTESVFLKFCTEQDRREPTIDRTRTPYNLFEINTLQNGIMDKGFEPLCPGGPPRIEGAMGLTAAQIVNIVAKSEIINTHDLSMFPHMTFSGWFEVGRLPLGNEGDNQTLDQLYSTAARMNARVATNTAFRTMINKHPIDPAILARIIEETKEIHELINNRYSHLQNPDDPDQQMAIDAFTARELYKWFLRDPYAINAPRIFRWAVDIHESVQTNATR
jgi:hypothetical protein